MTIYYVDKAVGSNGNAGTSEGAGNAWATIQYAVDNLAAADHVYVKASGNYNEAVTCATAGASTTSVTMEGYTTTPGDNGIVTIDAQSTRSFCVFGVQGTINYYIWKNFELLNSTGLGFSGSLANYQTILNCRAEGNASNGFTTDNNSVFVNCEAINNTGIGFDQDSHAVYVGNIAGGNGGDAFFSRIEGAQVAYKNLVYGLTGSSYVFTMIKCNAMIGNTMDCENTNAHILNSSSTVASSMVSADNIIYDYGNLPYQLPATSDSTSGYSISCYNLINSGGTITDDFNYQWQNITDAPGFEDEANDDYRLGGSSAAIDAGCVPGNIT